MRGLSNSVCPLSGQDAALAGTVSGSHCEPGPRAGAYQRMKKYLFFLGLAFFFYVLQRTGWSTLAEGMQWLGGYLALIFLLSGAKYAVSAMAWSAAFLPAEKQSWRRLFGARLAGEALNYLSVAGPLLGEPVKASMLERLRFTSGLASTLLETSVNAVSASVVAIAGLELLILSYSSSRMTQFATVATVVILFGFASGFLYLLKRRVPFLSEPYRRVCRLQTASARSVMEKLLLIEQRMHRLSFERPRAFASIFLLSFAAQGLALLEIYVILLSLGIRLDFPSLLIIEGFTKVAKTVFFFVPTRIGADEGSSAGVFVLLGLPAGAGVLLALARRLRALFWSGVGLLFLWMYSRKFSQRSQAVSETPGK